MKRQAWISFWLLGLIWGSSFMFIRIGVEEFKPVEVVFTRVFIAAIGLGLVILIRRVKVPTDLRTIASLAVIGLGNVVAPFMLITWGEQVVTSGMAAVLQSTAALFTLVFAHFAFSDERMTSQRVIGLIVGFVGVLVLFSDKLGAPAPTDGSTNPLLGQGAIVLASSFYAVFTILGRKLIQKDVAPVVVAFATMLTASIVTGPIALLTDGGFTPLANVSSRAIGSLLILGLLNTWIAYLFFYYIVRELGASRASMVTYIVPVVGLILGLLLLNEEVGNTLLLGAALIFSGIAIVNIKSLRRERLPEPAASPAK